MSSLAQPEAAKRLGVSRPALSNLLNGKAALSADMAFRLATAFGADRETLLERQALRSKARRKADLQQPTPVVLGLLKPATGLFGGPSRTGLLWALECLAWKPQNLTRISLILAQLSGTKIDDNWVNTPISSLAAIYRSWMPQTSGTIEDRVRALVLVERLDGMADTDQAAVWSLIDRWAAVERDERAKADLRERIRRFAFTRRGRLRGLADATRDRARATYNELTPSDPVVRHAWLFAKDWVDESVEESEDDACDVSKHEERIERLRADALKEIWARRRFDGVTALLAGGNASVRGDN